MIGLFGDAEYAARAIDALIGAGFARERLGLAMRIAAPDRGLRGALVLSSIPSVKVAEHELYLGGALFRVLSRTGFALTLTSALRRAGLNATRAADYERELDRGALAVSVELHRESDEEAARQILESSRGQGISMLGAPRRATRERPSARS